MIIARLFPVQVSDVLKELYTHKLSFTFLNEFLSISVWFVSGFFFILLFTLFTFAKVPHFASCHLFINASSNIIFIGWRPFFYGIKSSLAQGFASSLSNNTNLSEFWELHPYIGKHFLCVFYLSNRTFWFLTVLILFREILSHHSMSDVVAAALRIGLVSETRPGRTINFLVLVSNPGPLPLGPTLYRLSFYRLAIRLNT